MHYWQDFRRKLRRTNWIRHKDMGLREAQMTQRSLMGNRSTRTRRVSAGCAAAVCAAAVIGLGPSRLATAHGEGNHNEGPQRILQARVMGSELLIRLDRLGSRVPGGLAV